ncbi:MAG: aldose epimerase family protein [Phycisphaerales bacterium]
MSLITLTSERLRLSIMPSLGAGVADFSLMGPGKFAHPLMRRAAHDETNPSALGSFLLAPWCNRIAGAAFTFEGQTHTLRASGSDGSAMHGDVRARAWTILDRSPVSARLEFDSRLHESVNWPWPFVAQVRYDLDGLSMSIMLNVTNAGGSNMPAGCGHHPYFARRLFSDQDELHVRAGVTGRYPLQKAVPSGLPVADALTTRLAALAPWTPAALDDVFAGFGGTAELRWPASGVSLHVKSSPELGHLVLYSPHADASKPSPLPFVALEPVTQVNNALNLAGSPGTVVLAPGQTLSTRCDFTVALG